jgi:1-acyl-sn-glycerol-3-phosphate acyltransferase
LPVGRTDRSFIAWIKSKSFKQNINEILTGGTREVVLAFGKPRLLSAGADRKVLAKETEIEVRRMLVALNRGTPLPVAAE